MEKIDPNSEFLGDKETISLEDLVNRLRVSVSRLQAAGLMMMILNPPPADERGLEMYNYARAILMGEDQR
jgi:hypothetical protein